jgi:hypothetical protein
LNPFPTSEFDGFRACAGEFGRIAEFSDVARTAISRPSLGIHLMRQGVDSMQAKCHRCADCRRTPLMGETVYVFSGGKVVCELCRPLRRGEPVGSEPVRGGEHGATVRVRARAA